MIKIITKFLLISIFWGLTSVSYAGGVPLCTDKTLEHFMSNYNGSIKLLAEHLSENNKEMFNNIMQQNSIKVCGKIKDDLYCLSLIDIDSNAPSKPAEAIYLTITPNTTNILFGIMTFKNKPHESTLFYRMSCLISAAERDCYGNWPNHDVPTINVKDRSALIRLSNTKGARLVVRGPIKNYIFTNKGMDGNNVMISIEAESNS